MARIAALISLWLTLYGCVTTEIITALPPGHPADPQAAEAVFTPPPNPFADRQPSAPAPESEKRSGEHGHHPGGMP
jgi:hypothetical protein